MLKVYISLLVVVYLGIIVIFTVTSPEEAFNKNFLLETLFWPLLIIPTLALYLIELETFFIKKRKVKAGDLLRIAVDFDNTLCRQGYPNAQLGKATFLNLCIGEYIKAAQDKGAVILLNTLREDPVHLASAITWCENVLGFTPDYINENCPLNVAKWNADPRKLACDITIDDLSCGLFGFMLRLGV